MPHSENSSVVTVHPVTIEHRPKQRGPPLKVIHKAYLQEAIHPSRNLPKTKLARVLGVHRNTLKKKMDEAGVRSEYSSIEDENLDMLVAAYKTQKPDAGFRYALGHLRAVGIRVQKQRILDSLNRIDHIGRFIRRHAVTRRRKYINSRPNALWHCDGHHKLIKYGFVIHGFIDGHCRTVCHPFFSCSCPGSRLIHYLRLLPFMRVPTTMQVQFSNYSYQP